jgi:peroxiredoxin
MLSARPRASFGTFQVAAASLALAAVCGFGQALPAADAPTVDKTLTLFRPVQKDVEIETPAAEDFPKCKLSVERRGKTSGWVVLGPAGQVLRRFADADGDGVVDQWRYYNHGLEVYRDIDTNNNAKADQYRWLNMAGSRWAVDSNEDGKIDGWKVLSPEEAIRVAVTALIRGDEAALRTVLVTRDELREIGIADSYAEKIAQAVSDPGTRLRQIRSQSKVIKNDTAWVRSDNATSCSIPAEEGKLRNDLVVYENAMAIVETGGKSGLIQVGELVRTGDVWKLTQVPQPIEGASFQVAAGGVLMQPSLTAAVGAPSDTPAPSPEIQRMLADLQKLDQSSPQSDASPARLTEYNAQRADILNKLVDASKTDEEKNQWTRQMIDSIASAVQIGAYTEGLARLKSIEAEFRRATPKSEIVPYVVWRRLLSDYTAQHQGANSAKQQEIQKAWRDELEKFTKEFPQAEDTPEALMQLGIAYEFVGKIPEAKKWYAELVERHPQTPPGVRAAGALRRLDLKGKPFELTGPALDGKPIDARDFRGKVLLVAYWSTWCTACTEDLPALKALYDQHHAKGLEIVGVNLDAAEAPVAPFLKQHKVTWPQIYQAGGMQAPAATAFGIIVPPVMFVVDRQGKVAAVTTTVEEIKSLVPELLDKKPAS